MDIKTLDDNQGNRFVKVTFGKDEIPLIIQDLTMAADEYSYLSPTGLFTLSNLVALGSKPKSVEMTFGESGAMDLILDLDYKLRFCTKSPVNKLLVCHLQYFLMGNTVGKDESNATLAN